MGDALQMPGSRPMPSIGRRCHELRVNDSAADVTWRIVYRLDPDSVVIGDVVAKKTQRTPKSVIENCQRRFRDYDAACKDQKHGCHKEEAA